MSEWSKQIGSIHDVRLLGQMKEQLKDKVTNPTLKWDERMELYKQIQFIRHCIDNIEQKAT